MRDPLLDKEVFIPVEVKYLFEYFWKLRGGIGSSGFGPNPIGQFELFFWMSNFGIVLSPWEIDVIQKLDNIYMSHVNKQTDK